MSYKSDKGILENAKSLPLSERARKIISAVIIGVALLIPAGTLATGKANNPPALRSEEKVLTHKDTKNVNVPPFISKKKTNPFIEGLQVSPSNDSNNNIHSQKDIRIFLYNKNIHYI